MSRVNVTKAYAYRWINRGAAAPPDLADLNDFVMRFTAVTPAPGENICMTFGGASRNFSINGINDTWFPMLGTTGGIVNRIDMGTGAYYHSWNSGTGCSLGGPPDFDGNVPELTLDRSGLNHITRAQYTEVFGGSTLGLAFTTGNAGLVPSGNAVRWNNAITVPTALNVGVNGNIFIARGPLTSAQVQTLFDTI